MRKYVYKIFKQAKIEYYHTKLEKERNQPRKLWGTLNETTSRSYCKSNQNLKVLS